MKRGIFLDKDGTLVQDVPYNIDIHKIRFYPDIFDPLRELVVSGYSLILISNQSGIARGYFKEHELINSFDYISSYLEMHEIPITGYYFCPHHNSSDCNCRKPRPGLLQQAATIHGIDLAQSWMIGDILADVGAGRAAGCKTILMDRNRSERLLPLRFQPNFVPDHILDDFKETTNIVLNIN